jgi:hypothetical protein
MSVKLKLSLKAQVLLVVGLSMLSPSLSNAQEKVCNIDPFNSKWHCPFSTFKTEGRLQFKQLKLDDALSSAQTPEQAFSAMTTAYVKLGNLNDFEEWLRSQGFHVGPKIGPASTFKEDQIGAVDIIFNAADWEIFDTYWSFVERSLWSSYSRRDVQMVFDETGRPTEVRLISMK